MKNLSILALLLAVLFFACGCQCCGVCGGTCNDKAGSSSCDSESCSSCSCDSEACKKCPVTGATEGSCTGGDTKCTGSDGKCCGTCGGDK